ncbi:hypothetical protein F383_03613 [Gossypium arboreum]|uniref:Uncharacterized protein n=1 Tax=Gossypium arboreum TaxID=29729 RepID=A0A0B0PCU8_GOSAR|nr:hypothetical protein F383_03613 [Gossypium arboreum]
MKTIEEKLVLRENNNSPKIFLPFLAALVSGYLIFPSS